jgi:hypothetical protein
MCKGMKALSFVARFAVAHHIADEALGMHVRDLRFRRRRARRCAGRAASLCKPAGFDAA